MAEEPNEKSSPSAAPGGGKLKTPNQFWAEASIRDIEKELARKDLPEAERKPLERCLTFLRPIVDGTHGVRRDWGHFHDPWALVAKAQTGPLLGLPEVWNDDQRWAEKSMEAAAAVLAENHEFFTPPQRDALERWIEKTRKVAEGHT